MPDSVFSIRLIERLLKHQGIPEVQGSDPSNCCWHSDRGRHAFWRTMSDIMDSVRLLSGDRRPTALEAYQVMCAAHRKWYVVAKLKAETNPDQDRAGATPDLWWAMGWDEEASMVGLPTIDEDFKLEDM